MLPARRSSAFSPATFVFWLVAIVTLINLNHISNMIVGKGWFVTIGVALCCMFLILAVRLPYRQTLGLPGYLIVAALTFYVVIGAGVMLVTDTGWRTEDYRLPLRVVLGILMIVASASGAGVVLRRIGAEELLARILVIKAIVCILILATPLLVEHIYHSLPEHYRSTSVTRYMGTFKGPNFAGIAACQTVVLSLSLLNGRYRRFAWWAVILGGVATVMTYSKAAILALMLIIVFFLWSSMSDMYSRRRSATTWLALIVLAGGFGLMATNPGLLPLETAQLERIEWVEAFVTFESKSDPRFEIWSVAISLIAESPLFGHGLLQFHSIENASYSCNTDTMAEVACSAHNSYLMLWGEAGIVPLALFLLFVGALLRMRLVLPKSIAIDTVTGWTLVLALECMSTDNVPFLSWNAFIIGLNCALVAHVIRELRVRKANRAPEALPASVRTASYGATPS